MAKVITKTVYTYKELVDLRAEGNVTGKAIRRVKNWLRDGQTSDGWYEYIYECWTAALDQIGFTDTEINFSGFCSPGDGASFTADINIEKLADFLSTEIEPSKTIAGDPEDFRPWLVYQAGKATNPAYRRLAGIGYHLNDHKVERIGHHYYHESACRVRLSLTNSERTPKVCDLLEDFAKDAEILRHALSKAIYQALESEYEYLTGDKAIAEYAEANDYTFTIQGEREG